MKIDFHTHYRKESFDGLCKKAISMGLDGLVVEGFPRDYPRVYESLRLFPAREVLWRAILKVPYYSERITPRERLSKKIQHTGNALVLLPLLSDFQGEFQKNLYELLDDVHNLGGVVIALHNNKNAQIVCEKIDRNTFKYPFDGVRINPSSYDCLSETMTGMFRVAGSDSYSAEDLIDGKGYTVIEDIKNSDDLISVIQSKNPTDLYVHNSSGHLLKIEDTIGKYDIRSYLEKIGFIPKYENQPK